MGTIRHVLEIRAPLERVFQAWTAYPELLGHFDLVLDHTEVEGDLIRLNYKRLFGRQVQLTIQVTEIIPNRVIAWKTLDGAIPLAGSASFEGSETETFVTFVFSFDPPFAKFGDLVAKTLRYPSANIESGLESLVRAIEDPSE